MKVFIATLLSAFCASSSAWTTTTTTSVRTRNTALLFAAPNKLGEAPDYLLDRIGGDAALEAAVDELYNRLIADESLAKYFEGVSMEVLKDHQFNFMRIAFTEIPEELDVSGMLTEGHSRLWKMVCVSDDVLRFPY